MAILKAFKGLRPPKGISKELASRPYDVLNSAEAREEAKGNPYSLLHIIKPEIDLPVGIDEHEPEVYAKAKENLEKFLKFTKESDFKNIPQSPQWPSPINSLNFFGS